MYEAFFNMRRRPFTSAPQASCYFASGSPERARQVLSRAIERAEGLGLMIGPAGIGKTLILQVLAEQFRSQFQVALLAGARLVTRRALLQNILFELGLPYRNMEEGELRLSLLDFLSRGEASANGLLLLVDEGHSLPLRLLEEIRMMTNLVRDGAPRVRLVLSGNSSLEDRFASPKLESLNQRVAVRCYVDTLSNEETALYVRWHLERASCATDLFTVDALRAVASASDGVPRLINQICDHALVMACAAGIKNIDAAQIDDAWADLQQLPMPMAEKPLVASSGAIEFGSLSEDTPLDRTDSFATEEAAILGATGNKIDQRLEAIERQVAAAGADWPSEDHLAAGEVAAHADFHPSGRFSNEVELTFHGPHNPFDEIYLEEEILLDPYANLDSIHSRPRVRSEEGKELAAMLSQYEKRHGRAPLADSTQYTPHSQIDRHPRADRSDRKSPDIDVVQPPVDYDSDAPDIVRPPHVLANLEESDDDRDILVIEDEHPTSPVASRARRQEYRQLFAQLRRG